MRKAVAWVGLAAATAAVASLLHLAGLPSPSLFGALLVGLALALTLRRTPQVPDVTFRAAQALTGVVLGAYLQSSSLSAVAESWLPVMLVSAATLAVTLAAGAGLARLADVDPPTAALGMVAGGASGIVTMADDLGADDRLVAFMQYMRVLIVVMLTPLLVAVAFPGHHAGHVHLAHEAPFGDTRGWLLTLALAPAGAALGRLTRVPASVLLGPMILSGIVTLAVPGGAFTVPPVVREVSFALIGLQVGLRFTLPTVRRVGRLFLPVVASVLALMVACAGLAAALAATAPISMLDAYLATTPGGLYAVLAVAVGAGANTTFIVAAQGLRLLVMVLLAPLAVRWIVRRGA